MHCAYHAGLAFNYFNAFDFTEQSLCFPFFSCFRGCRRLGGQSTVLGLSVSLAYSAVLPLFHL
jgi:hypothetical protein